MKKYSVSVPRYASVIIEVEAENKKEAVKLALDQADVVICNHCSRHIQMDAHDDSQAPDVLEIK